MHTKNTYFLIFTVSLVFLILLAAPFSSALPFITGIVNDALDGTNADGHEIVLWNPANGIDDNLTDIIGPLGNSGTSNLYFLDCALLNTPCAVGDELRARVLNNGSDYITNTTNLTVSGLGFQVMPNLTLNSPPVVNLTSPIDFANISALSANLSCIATDLDGNLANITLYGNWTGSWHANQTLSTSGSETQANFTAALPNGHYEWACLATDDLSISAFSPQNYTFSLDTNPPEITSIGLNLTGDVCGTQEILRINCTATDSLLSVETVLIESTSPSGSTNHSTALLAGDTYFADINLNETGIWSFSCIANDTAGNSAINTSLNNLDIHSNLPDLMLNSSDIVFETADPIENQPIQINATIHNNGCSDANNFIVGFFKGNSSNGNQINGNQTISLLGLNSTVVNVTWPAEIGTTNVFVLADSTDLISEANESDNEANNTIIVRGWQEFYGNLSIDRILANQNISNLTIWQNETTLSGNVFIADTESNVNWFSLQAIGKNSTGQNTANDFLDIDTLLNMTTFNDSVANRFTTDGNTPILEEDFLVHESLISQVAIINSTNNTNFVTGILWDTSDDSSGEYDITEKEDLVFVTKVNQSHVGAYGTYDYEITIPVRLREYDPTDTQEVFIYFDLD